MDQDVGDLLGEITFFPPWQVAALRAEVQTMWRSRHSVQSVDCSQNTKTLRLTGIGKLAAIIIFVIELYFGGWTSSSALSPSRG